MFISNRKRREKLTEKVIEASKYMEKDSIEETLEDFSEIELTEIVDYKKDSYIDKDCTSVFAESIGEKKLSFIQRFLLNFFPKKYLSLKGFDMSNLPKENSWALYVERVCGFMISQHIGKYNLGKVHSKIGNSHFYKHDIDAVPHIYGNEVLFYSKRDR